MTEQRTLTLPTTHGPIHVNAHTTTTAGLYIYRNGTTWRLAHHTGHTLADFQYDQHAHNAAKALGSITDWTRTAEQIRVDITVLVYDVHDAIHDNGGRFLYRPNGPAAHALAARGD